MKKLASILISITILFSVIPYITVANAAVDTNDTYSDGDWQYKYQDDNTVSVIGYNGKAENIQIPANFDGCDVTSVSSTAFYSSHIKKISIPDTVTEIGWWAFYGCKNLSHVSFGNRLKTIGYGAFMNCTQLKSIEIPPTISIIGDDAFAVSCTVNTNVFDPTLNKKVSTQKYYTDSSFKIIGYSGTYAEKYATDHLLYFSSIDKVNYGDINCDGKIDDKDTSLISRYLSNNIALSQIQLCNADIDNDLEVTENDKQLLEKYISNDISYYTLPAVKNLYASPDYLSGKSMYCDGDSVAFGTGTNTFGNDCFSYCHYIAQKYNMDMQNKAVSGTTLAKIKSRTKDSNKSILERVTNMNGNYDIILLEGGFNDLFEKVKIGTVTPDDDRSGNYDEYTTAGALESICYFLQKNYRDSTKLFVLCHKLCNKERQPEYWNVIKEILKKWEIDYIDLSEETQLTNINKEISTQYFRLKNNKGDGVHPLVYTNQKIYGPYIAQKLNSMLQEQTSLTIADSEINMGFLESYHIEPCYSSYVGKNNIRWTSCNDTVATVDKNGLITACGIGSTTIKGCSSDGKTVSLTVNVKLMPVDLKLNKSELSLKCGENFTLNGTVLDGTASLTKTFDTSDNSVADVSENNGNITAIAPGTATITCRTSNGVKARCIVTVTE